VRLPTYLLPPVVYIPVDLRSDKRTGERESESTPTNFISLEVHSVSSGSRLCPPRSFSGEFKGCPSSWRISRTVPRRRKSGFKGMYGCREGGHDGNVTILYRYDGVSSRHLSRSLLRRRSLLVVLVECAVTLRGSLVLRNTAAFPLSCAR